MDIKPEVREDFVLYLDVGFLVLVIKDFGLVFVMFPHLILEGELENADGPLLFSGFFNGPEHLMT